MSTFRGALFGIARTACVFVVGTLVLVVPARGQTYQVLKAFATEGQHPQAGLIEVDGSFYGTTVQGGEAGIGTIFRLDADGTFTTLHDFAVAEGSHPYAGLLHASDGNLYGMTSVTIFRIAPDGSGFATVHSFNGSDGAYPYGALIEGLDGNLYGTTSQGGAQNIGTIFKIDKAGTE